MDNTRGSPPATPSNLLRPHIGQSVRPPSPNGRPPIVLPHLTWFRYVLFVEHHSWFDEIWHTGPATYIHGDTHIGNVFLDGDRVGFLDWGCPA